MARNYLKYQTKKKIDTIYFQLLKNLEFLLDAAVITCGMGNMQFRCVLDGSGLKFEYFEVTDFLRKFAFSIRFELSNDKLRFKSL